MKKLLVLCVSLLFLASCLQTNQGAKNLPKGAGQPAIDTGYTPKTNNKYYLPKKFNCFNPGTKESKPGHFNEFQCMVCNCVHEAGNESHEGKVSVGRVVMSRLANKAYPSRGVCDVIYQRKQFSWTNGSKIERKIIPRSRGKKRQVEQCRKAMIDVYENHTTKTYATHYWSPCGVCYEKKGRVKYYLHGGCRGCTKRQKEASWSHQCRSRKKIGNHIFCMGGVGGVRPMLPRGPVSPRYSKGAIAYCPINRSEDYANEI